MKISEQTSRSGEIAYEFTDDIFNAKLPHSRGNQYYQDIEPQETDNYVKPSELDAKLIQAWNEKVPNACQRDYIYYNMSKANPSKGLLDINIREKLLKFKIDPTYLDNLSMSTSDTDNDPKFNSGFRKEKAAMTTEEIYQHMWTDIS